MYYLERHPLLLTSPLEREVVLNPSFSSLFSSHSTIEHVGFLSDSKSPKIPKPKSLGKETKSKEFTPRVDKNKILLIKNLVKWEKNL